MKLRILFSIVFMVLAVHFVFAEDENKKDKTVKGYVFEDEIVIPATPIKDQYRTGTCWSFSGLSFLESEMLRLGNHEVDLSEMFIVWHTYLAKARKHVRVHGNLSFSAGGAFHDVTNMISKFGIVPESVYNGLKYGEEKHVHGEMDRVLLQHIDAVIENKNRKLSTVWNEAMEATLNSYLGEIPQKFEYEGKQFTPQSFASDFVSLNMDDYVEISSYTHHPFYSKFILEVPDNWSWDEMYNVPINELEEIIDYSLKNSFTVAWAADVSEKGFVTSNKGVAVLPAKLTKDMSDAEIARWESLSEKDKEKELYQFEEPVPEMVVTQEMRQAAFDNYQTTDDHGMHIVGTAKDQEGRIFYKVKNSWGDYNKYKGYFYASKPYVNYKTMCIMVHKDGIPKSIKEKLEL
ncbi:MAG: aminopeptidase [Prolixibacteraceae bacterium]|jgi:bleomycin hydrolase|nr:aminopeptidase [Prolixibacteraceae bacterium]MBT6005626.1 aminopeptidase [Prolixibacteraceae bacterium]MBT6764829.1 aminopeptidase [Prolixibacteraceae bacterium]MBT6996930.1 aminopeptidase [Prolixibacteraceae bacterium]MBT7395386.1 aminopeptidase [Prolixibacteraceae bacterium]